MKKLFILASLFYSLTHPVFGAFSYFTEETLPQTQQYLFEQGYTNALYTHEDSTSLQYNFFVGKEHLYNVDPYTINKLELAHEVHYQVNQEWLLYYRDVEKQAEFRYEETDSDTLFLSHQQHDILIGTAYKKEMWRYLLEYNTNNSVTVGLGYKDFFLRYFYRSQTQRDSLSFWTQEFAENNFSTIHALYQTRLRKAGVTALYKWNTHFFEASYQEMRRTPVRSDISDEPVDSTYYWLSDSTQGMHFNTSYSYIPPSFKYVLKASQYYSENKAESKGRWQSANPPPFDSNIKIFHYSKFKITSQQYDLVFHYFPKSKYTLRFNTSYRLDAIQSNQLDSTDRTKDFLRYNNLFRSTAEIIIASSYFRQSDFVEFDLSMHKLSFHTGYKHKFKTLSLEVSLPLQFFWPKGTLKRENYLIPTLPFQSPTLEDEDIFQPKGMLMLSPVHLRLSLDFKKVLFEIGGTQLIPLYNSLSFGNNNESEKKSEARNSEIFQNGFQFLASFKLKF